MKFLPSGSEGVQGGYLWVDKDLFFFVSKIPALTRAYSSWRSVNDFWGVNGVSIVSVVLLMVDFGRCSILMLLFGAFVRSCFCMLL